ncbi:MAG: RnfABCDGE type electron transport complex subunit A [Elusimicrobiota bacterium]|nr:RnfABCDGE type electron transport complex subunit A [Endomicrobiia bacterium]MDW8164957.1 RnfABCDGE type electron transport complex subunit A [Elusimicrobiota bacterium]
MEKISLLGIFISSIFVNNIILMRFLGLCSFFGVSNKFSSALGMSAAVFFVMNLAAVVSWLLYNYVLLPLNLEFLKIIVFILIISSLVQLVELFMKKVLPALFKALGIYLPLITTNCAILAVAFLIVDYQYNLLQTVVFSSGTAIGYTLAIILFSSIREKLELAPLPNAVKGYGIVFVTSALMSLSFMGFIGLFGF